LFVFIPPQIARSMPSFLKPFSVPANTVPGTLGLSRVRTKPSVGQHSEVFRVDQLQQPLVKGGCFFYVRVIVESRRISQGCRFEAGYAAAGGGVWH
jgi:hypothetical protein